MLNTSLELPTRFESGLTNLLRQLAELDYRFVTPGNGTIRRNRERRAGAPRVLDDIFGWSLKFESDDLAPNLFATAREAGLLEPVGRGWRSRVRVSAVGGVLFAHSAYPTNTPDAVFLGPDTYRFARFVAEHWPATPPQSVLDVGTGSGVGAVLAAKAAPGARVLGSDVNRLALSMAGANAAAAGVAVQTMLCDDPPPLEGGYDLILANPPFISSASSRRVYSNGGGIDGAEISLRWALDGAAKLSAGGRMLLYTGSSIRSGEDRLRSTLAVQLPNLGCSLEYGEIDPDIFGGLLRSPEYEGVERIAAVGAVITRQPSGF
jgi:SAM-dependent methyltransferase